MTAVTRFLLLILLVGSFAALGFTVPEDTVHSGIAPVEDFLLRTVRRINDAWLMADIEFDRAGQVVAETPERIGEAIRQKTEDAVKDAIRDQVNQHLGGAPADPVPQTPETPPVPAPAQ